MGIIVTEPKYIESGYVVGIKDLFKLLNIEAGPNDSVRMKAEGPTLTITVRSPKVRDERPDWLAMVEKLDGPSEQNLIDKYPLLKG